ncbi:MAG: hypothetical protein NUV65_01255 [Candidatus Roizmanbacteria bacterium]|nr:hypothetical protein [Candidatus Roizmanbacteria bacterium]
MHMQRVFLLCKKTILWVSMFALLTVVQFSVVLATYSYVHKSSVVMSALFLRTGDGYNKQKSALILGEETGPGSTDARKAIIQDFIQRYNPNSPLLAYIDTMMSASDKYNLHYGLLPAIAMVESGLCRKIPEYSYNCWGWGIYGKNVIRFSSYNNAIETVAKGLGERYVQQGLSTPEDIVRKYNPTNHNDWSGSVRYFLNIFE